MKPEHLLFVTEYLRTGNKAAAYHFAYPDNAEESAFSSAKRLLTRTDIKQYLDETYTRLRKEAEEEIKERMKGEIISTHTAQVILSQIITSQHTVTKEINVKGCLQTVEIKPSHPAIISALNAFFRLNGMFIPRSAKPAPEPTPESEEKVKNREAMMAELAAIAKRNEEITCGRPHPYGETYPMDYRGPYYDPGDPNTREIFLNLMERFRKEALEKGEPFHMYDAHLNGTAINPYSLDGKTPYFHNYKQEQDNLSQVAQSNTLNNSSVSATIGNNVLINTPAIPNSLNPKPHNLQNPWIPRDGAYITIAQALTHNARDHERRLPGWQQQQDDLFMLRNCKNKNIKIKTLAQQYTGWCYHPDDPELIRPNSG